MDQLLAGTIRAAHITLAEAQFSAHAIVHHEDVYCNDIISMYNHAQWDSEDSEDSSQISSMFGQPNIAMHTVHHTNETPHVVFDPSLNYFCCISLG